MLNNLLKGWWGECQVNLMQKLLLDKETYHQLNNVTIKSSDGTTQIDHIIVSSYGIFVIETKNYKGWIFGDKSSKVWTQSLYGKKSTFQNPLLQNYRHTKVLQEFLELDQKFFHSIIMFIGDSTFKTEMPENVMDKGYISYIKSKDRLLLSPTKVSEIVESLKTGKLPNSFKTRKEHLQSLKERHNPIEIAPKPDDNRLQPNSISKENVDEAPKVEETWELSIETLQKIEWFSFELFCKTYYEAIGYNVTKTGPGPDKGIDLILYDKERSEPAAIVQCKSRTTRDISVNYVRELLGVMTSEKAEKGILITNSGFTKDATEFANAHTIEMVDVYKFWTMIDQLDKDQKRQLHNFLKSTDFITPTCPNCETKLVERTAKKGANVGQKFWGCRNFPKCRYNLKKSTVSA